MIASNAKSSETTNVTSECSLNEHCSAQPGEAMNQSASNMEADLLHPKHRHQHGISLENMLDDCPKVEELRTDLCSGGSDVMDYLSDLSKMLPEAHIPSPGKEQTHDLDPFAAFGDLAVVCVPQATSTPGGDPFGVPAEEICGIPPSSNAPTDNLEFGTSHLSSAGVRMGDMKAEAKTVSLDFDIDASPGGICSTLEKSHEALMVAARVSGDDAADLVRSADDFGHIAETTNPRFFSSGMDDEAFNACTSEALLHERCTDVTAEGCGGARGESSRIPGTGSKVTASNPNEKSPDVAGYDHVEHNGQGVASFSISSSPEISLGTSCRSSSQATDGTAHKTASESFTACGRDFTLASSQGAHFKISSALHMSQGTHAIEDQWGTQELMNKDHVNRNNEESKSLATERGCKGAVDLGGDSEGTKDGFGDFTLAPETTEVDIEDLKVVTDVPKDVFGEFGEGAGYIEMDIEDTKDGSGDVGVSTETTKTEFVDGEVATPGPDDHFGDFGQGTGDFSASQETTRGNLRDFKAAKEGLDDEFGEFGGAQSDDYGDFGNAGDHAFGDFAVPGNGGFGDFGTGGNDGFGDFAEAGTKEDRGPGTEFYKSNSLSEATPPLPLPSASEMCDRMSSFDLMALSGLKFINSVKQMWNIHAEGVEVDPNIRSEWEDAAISLMLEEPVESAHGHAGLSTQEHTGWITWEDTTAERHILQDHNLTEIAIEAKLRELSDGTVWKSYAGGQLGATRGIHRRGMIGSTTNLTQLAGGLSSRPA